MNNIFSVTLKQLRQHDACFSGYNRVVRMLQGKPFSDEDQERESYIKFTHAEPVSLLAIMENNGLDDALWALRCIKTSDRDLRLFAVWCARQVEHLMTDSRSKNALDVAERYSNWQATANELAAAWAAASAAARDAGSASSASAWAAASAAAWSASSASAWAAASAAAWSAARSAARDAARDAQKEMFIKMCNETAPWQKKAEVVEC